MLQTADGPMHDESLQVRGIVFEEHEALRDRLDTLETLLVRSIAGEGAAFVQARRHFQDLLEFFLRHLDTEEGLLRPILGELEAWGPVRLEQLEREHDGQRLQVAELAALDTDTSVGHWTNEMRRFSTQLRAEMAGEEHDFLDPNVLRDDRNPPPRAERQPPVLDAQLLARYGTVPVPRYTSYPSANLWKPQEEAFAREVFSAAGSRPLSVYVHVPFCRKLCFYCGCNMLVTQRQALGERYLKAIDVEIARVAALLKSAPKVVQVHLGGGTPTWLDVPQLTRLIQGLRRHFPFARGIEASIEVHPPVTSFEQVRALAQLGFNRLSMGVQDFDPDVQQRVNRPQPFGQTRDLIECARAEGMKSVNVDLMYGLPLQTPARFAHTLDLIEQLRPDRIALFGYAHLPQLKKHQRAIDPEELPGPEQRLQILELAIDRLAAAGYRSIGLDHFALEDDELCVARAQGTLRRNFMGYTTCAQSDVISFGPSSISEIGGSFVQNAPQLHDWADRVERGLIPVVRGWRSSADDDLRRALIMALFCQLELDTTAFGRAHQLDFERTFAPELVALAPLEQDGLVTWRGATLVITAAGQLLLRNVAAVFDAWLPKLLARQHAPAL